uniref:Uncharacterized protein n=1 Tax=Leersia perrieri TaxID=77586 RepID=A0A0D9UZT9_9ORYZ
MAEPNAARSRRRRRRRSHSPSPPPFRRRPAPPRGHRWLPLLGECPHPSPALLAFTPLVLACPARDASGGCWGDPGTMGVSVGGFHCAVGSCLFRSYQIKQSFSSPVFKWDVIS